VARYSQFLGRRVEVHYRAGDILLPATGTFVADSGRSIFLEEHFQQRGQEKHFRWEIPYQFIVRLEEKPGADVENSAAKDRPAAHASEHRQASEPEPSDGVSRSARVNAGGRVASLLPAPNPPKTA
jgi:hypothetical protein